MKARPAISALTFLALSVGLAALAPSPAQSVVAQPALARPSAPEAKTARVIAANALRAAEQSRLAPWSLPWREQLRRNARDRSALFALASAARFSYEFPKADSLYARVEVAAAHDMLSRQAKLGRAILAINDGRVAIAAERLAQLEEESLQEFDTLTALDAVLARSGVILKMEGANAALAAMARSEPLNWKREPALDAAVRCRKAGIHSRLGEHDVARRLAHEGETIAVRAELPRLRAACLFVLGTDFAVSGISDSLASTLMFAIDLQKRSNDLAGFAASNQWAGYYVMSLGNVSFAQRYLTLAWDAAVRAKSMDGTAWTALNRAGLAQHFYDAKGTTLWLARADTLMRKLGDVQGRLEVARMMGEYALVSGNVSDARARLTEALRVTEGLGEPNAQLSILSALWTLAMYENQLDSAASWLNAESALIERYKMTGWRMAVAYRRGKLALKRGDAGRALAAIDSVVPTLHALQQEFLYELQTQRALAQAMLGDARSAARTALAAAESFDKFRTSLSDSALRSLSVEAQRDQGWFTSSLVARLADAGQVAVAFELVERRRARDLREHLMLAASGRARASALPNLSDNAGEAGGVNIAAIQRMLPDTQTALVMLNAGEEGARGTAFILTRQTLTAHSLPSAEEVSPRVRRFVSLLEAGRDADIEARALGKALIGALLPQLDRAGVTRLVFMPEGVLYRLPFDALRLPDGKFLAERFETAVAPSAAVLGRLLALPASNRSEARVLALADPDVPGIGQTDGSLAARLISMVFKESAPVPRLTGARDEATRVQRAFPTTSVRAGARALEADVKKESAQYDVLHFATHAIVDEWSGANAALALAAGGGEDGLLDSGEIAQLRLSASIVVLSACRTVGGEVIAGEGVRGLTTAFLQAGARSVVATSWRVHDRAIVPLVGAFYDGLARGRTVGAALRDARIAAIRSNVSPSVWGAFSLVGDPWRRIATGPAER